MFNISGTYYNIKWAKPTSLYVVSSSNDIIRGVLVHRPPSNWCRLDSFGCLAGRILKQIHYLKLQTIDSHIHFLLYKLKYVLLRVEALVMHFKLTLGWGWALNGLVCRDMPDRPPCWWSLILRLSIAFVSFTSPLFWASPCKYFNKLL